MFETRDARKKRLFTDIPNAARSAESWRGEGADEDGRTLAHVRDDARTNFERCKEFASDEPSAFLLAADAYAFVSTKLGEWAVAQQVRVDTSKLLDSLHGKGATPAVTACLDLVAIMLTREQFDPALVCIADRLLHVPRTSAAALALDLQRVKALSALERHDLATGAAAEAFGRTRQLVGDQTPASAAAARGFALALVAASRDLDDALALAQFGCPPPPRSLNEVPDFLEGAITVLSVLLARGDMQLAAETAERARAAISRHTAPRGGAKSRELELWGQHARALEGLGLADKAAELLRMAINQMEQTEHAFVPGLLPLLEGLTRVVSGIERAEAEQRAEALRTTITGRPRSPARAAVPAQTRAPAATWPRRTPAGVFTVSNADEAVLTRVLNNLRRSAGPARLWPRDGAPSTFTVVLDGWEDPFDPARAARNRTFATRLADMLHGAAVASRDAGASFDRRIEIRSWWRVEDELSFACPAQLQDQWRRELFPRLPGWKGDARRYAWLGAGFVVGADGGELARAEPSLVLELAEDRGVTFRGCAPAELLDAWFEAFARMTGLLRSQPFTSFSAGSPVVTL